MIGLNRTEVNALSSISKGSSSIKEIAVDLKRSHTRSTVIVRSLEEKGFLTRSRKGLEYKVSLTGNPFVNTIKPLLRTRDRRLSLMTDNGLFLLGLLSGVSQALTKNDLVRYSALSPSTVRDFLNTGVKTTTLRRIGRTYHISRSSEDLRSFIEEYSSYSIGKELAKRADDFTVHWRLGFETIYSSSCTTKDQMTGPTGFRKFGLDLIATRSYHHFTPFPRRIGIEEMAIDNILLNMDDPRNIVNTALFLARNMPAIDTSALLFIAGLYNIQDICLDILSFIDGRTDHIENVIGREDFDDKLEIY